MNHDTLSSTINSALFTVYNILLEEYKNEEIAKKNTLNLTKKELGKFGMKGDVTNAYQILSKEYELDKNESEKYELYKKLTILQDAIAIIKEVGSDGR